MGIYLGFAWENALDLINPPLLDYLSSKRSVNNCTVKKDSIIETQG